MATAQDVFIFSGASTIGRKAQTRVDYGDDASNTVRPEGVGKSAHSRSHAVTRSPSCTSLSGDDSVSSRSAESVASYARGQGLTTHGQRGRPSWAKNNGHHTNVESEGNGQWTMG